MNFEAVDRNFLSFPRAEYLIGVIVVLISFLSIAHGYFKYSFRYWKARNVPHDEPSIPFGNIKGFATKWNPGVLFKQMYDKYKSSGKKFFGTYFFSRPVAIVQDLDLVKNILVKDFSNFQNKGFFYDDANEPRSAHVFVVDSPKWKPTRDKLSPIFSSGRLKSMFPVMIEVAERFRANLIQHQNHVQLEMKDLIDRFLTDMNGASAFGIDCNCMSEQNSIYATINDQIFVNPRHGQLALIFLAGWKSIAIKFQFKRLHEGVVDFFTNIVDELFEYREKNHVKRNDYVDTLMKLKNQAGNKAMSRDEIIANALVLFVAGFKMSSAVLTNCLYELAFNPDIQTKARDEIRQKLAKHGAFTYEMLLDLPYIDKIIKETLRKYPPLSIVNRNTANDYQVPGTNDVIEKDVDIVIPVYAIHHDPEYYPEPEKFNPDRFNIEAVKGRHPMAYIPFGSGPRNCIGARIGMIQVRIGLVTMLRSFDFSLNSRTEFPFTINPKALVLSSSGGIYMDLKVIDQEPMKL